MPLVSATYLTFQIVKHEEGRVISVTVIQLSISLTEMLLLCIVHFVHWQCPQFCTVTKYIYAVNSHLTF